MPILLDYEISDALTFLMRKNRTKVILGDRMDNLEIRNDEVCITTKAGRTLIAEKALVAMGRVGSTASWGIEELGIKTNKRALIQVDENFYTGCNRTDMRSVI